MLDAPRYPKVLLDEHVLTSHLVEMLLYRTRINHAPLLGDLASGDAVDADTRSSLLIPGRRCALKPDPPDADVPELGDDSVTLGNLLLDGEAGGREFGEDLRYRALEVLAGRTLSGHQAAVDEVGRHQLVNDIEVSFGHVLLQEAAGDGLVLFSLRRHSRACSSPG